MDLFFEKINNYLDFGRQGYIDTHTLYRVFVLNELYGCLAHHLVAAICLGLVHGLIGRFEHRLHIP